MKFAKWSYLIAGIYGVLSITPLYVSESQIGIDYPPAITHPEFYYGFTGVTLAWQLAFLLIGRNPQHYRALMPITVLEKLGYALPAIVLYLQQRISTLYFATGLIDLLLGILFVIAYLRTEPDR
jgi:hypothetical protein